MLLKYKLKVFGIGRDILGGSEVVFETGAKTVGELRADLLNQHPKLQALNSLLIAVNQTYANEGATITQTDEIAVIPPVSGG
ncbi:MAG: MoaD/ThiS family protein [Bacteroidetes bacterium]|nr:MoaD/ThiS family protein [Bacteroidota bacterium]